MWTTLLLKGIIAGTAIIIVFAPQVLCAPPEAEDCGAVINHKLWSCRIDGKSLVQEYRTSITVLNKKGEDFGTLSLRETPFVKIKKLKARLFDSNGKKIIERDKKDFSRACGYDNIAVYADICHFYTTLSAAQYPYTVEWEYIRESQSLLFWPEARFQDWAPVSRAGYTLDIPEGFPFQFREYDFELAPVISEPVSGRVTYTWEVTNLPALEDIDYTVPDENLPARIKFAAKFSLDNYQLKDCRWDEIGRWYNAMAADRYSRHRLFAGLTVVPENPRRTLESVFDYVVNNIRYVAIQIGIGGWQPHHSQKTHERGFGDCKDMATLLLSELRNLGIECYPALVLTRDEGFVDPAFPSPDFNHVIAVAIVDDDTLWMDPTCKKCRYNELPVAVQDRPALVMTTEGGQLWKTPPTTADDNLTTRRTRWTIKSDLTAEFTSIMSITGNYARYLRGAVPGLDNDRTRQLVIRQFPGAEKKFRIRSYEFTNLDSLHLPVGLKIEASLTKPVKTIGNTIYFDPFALNELTNAEKTNLSDRQFSLDLYYPDIEEDIITVTWDLSTATDSIVIPENESFGFSSGSFSLTSSAEESGITIHIRKTYDAYLIKPEQFADFTEFREHLKKALAQYVKFYRN